MRSGATARSLWSTRSSSVPSAEIDPTRIPFMLLLPTWAVRSGEGPPNPAHFLDSAPHRRKQARAPVIVPEAVAFKLQTTTGFPWPHHRAFGRPRLPTYRGLQLLRDLPPQGPPSLIPGRLACPVPTIPEIAIPSASPNSSRRRRARQHAAAPGPEMHSRPQRRRRSASCRQTTEPTRLASPALAMIHGTARCVSVTLPEAGQSDSRDLR